MLEQITKKWVQTQLLFEKEWKFLHYLHERGTRQEGLLRILAPSDFCRAFDKKIGTYWCELIALMLDAKSKRTECVPQIYELLNTP